MCNTERNTTVITARNKQLDCDKVKVKVIAEQH